MSFHFPVEKIESEGCSLVLRRITGPHARELFFSCQPPPDLVDPGAQAEAIYRAIRGLLESEGGTFGSVVSEMVFFSSVQRDIRAFREARERVYAQTGEQLSLGLTTTEIEQPPLNAQSAMEVSVHALFPHEPLMPFESFAVSTGSGSGEYVSAAGVRVGLGEEFQLYTGAFGGSGDNAFEQTRDMFELAEQLLLQAGMAFSDVVRTWIHLREMDRDYSDLNRARRAFFESRGIHPLPASTGIGGAPVSSAHDICLSLYALKASTPVKRTVMTSKTLNEAPEYGADFVRGMRVAEANKVSLLISGTASVDEVGDTVHVGDFEAQAERMLVNIAALLEGQGAGFQDIVFAITYLKHPANERLLREKLQAAGFEGFPHVFVVAPVCRPELLCETEALAVLPVVAD